MTDSKLHKIFRMDLNTKSYVSIPLSNSDNPIAIDYDFIESRIYWTDVGLRQVRSATLDGTDEKIIRLLPASKFHGHRKTGWLYETFETKFLN